MTIPKRLLNSGLGGQYNATIAKLVLAANHGMSDKQEISGADGKPLILEVVDAAELARRVTVLLLEEAAIEKRP